MILHKIYHDMYQDGWKKSVLTSDKGLVLTQGKQLTAVSLEVGQGFKLKHKSEKFL